MNEEFSFWVEALVNEGYDLSDYSWDEMYDIYENLVYEETLDEKKAREERIAARRARVKQMEQEGKVMTSSKRTSRRAAKRRQEKAQEAREAQLAQLASGVLSSLGHTGKVSEKPMGSEGPEAKEAAPEATRRLATGLRRDNLGSAADKILRSMKKEEYEVYEGIQDYLIDEGYVNDYESADTMIQYMSEDWLEDIIESKLWIQDAIKKPGSLRASLKVKSGKNIPVKKLTAASHKGGKMGKRARLAMTLRSFH